MQMKGRKWVAHENRATGSQISAHHGRLSDRLWKAKVAAKSVIQSAHDDHTHLDHDGRRQHDSEFVKLTMNAVRLNVKLANQLEFWQSVTLIAIAKLTSLLAFTLKALLEQFEFLLKVSEPTIRFDPEPRTGPPPLEHRPTIQPNAPALI
jgi:hypothetical protein